MGVTVPTLARAKDEPTAADRRRVEAALRSIQVAHDRVTEAQRIYAALVRELGISRCAHAEGVSRQVVYDRLKHWGAGE